MNRNFWKGKKVLLTGHTGFKGTWLSLWLTDMGAEVHGYALNPDSNNSIATSLNITSEIKSSTINDIRNLTALLHLINQIKPEVVFHLAAQALVHESYKKPLETFSVNVMGTVTLLEAIRLSSGVKAVINVTTDKCYKNMEWLWPYREEQRLGGSDPYSNSKTCSEHLTSSYRESFFLNTETSIATARAGNVIGGGDRAENRLIPDFFRALENRNILQIRSPNSVRPWQHVLEPLSGYLTLAEALFNKGRVYAEPWNFGPAKENCQSVKWILNYLSNCLPEAKWAYDKAEHPHETQMLTLDSSKANSVLGWKSIWNLNKTLDETIAWESAFNKGSNMIDFSLNQIHSFESDKKINE